MDSYTRYRTLSLLPLLIITLGIIFMGSSDFNRDHLEIIVYAQTASVVAGIAAYIVGVMQGMRHSGVIILALMLPMLYLIFIWGLAMDFPP